MYFAAFYGKKKPENENELNIYYIVNEDMSISRIWSDYTSSLHLKAI